jgi:hypothetical protein
MADFLPQSIQDELAQARKAARRKKSRWSVHIADEAVPIVEYNSTGFAVDADDAPRLRGLIDIFEGSRHLFQALIVASARDGDVMRYEFKRNTAAGVKPPSDFDEGADAPTILLPKG